MTIAPVLSVVEVKAAPARAFALFTARMSAWWPGTHSIGATPQAEVIVEPRAGGRWFERGEDGVEWQWGRVLAWEPPTRLLLAWQINGTWKYDPGFETEIEITFTDLAPGTRVRLEHRQLERFGETAAAMARDLSGGWPSIVGLYATFANISAGD